MRRKENVKSTCLRANFCVTVGALAFRTMLALVLTGLFFGHAQSPGDEIILQPVGDSFVGTGGSGYGDPNRNHCSETELSVGVESAIRTESFLKFDVSTSVIPAGSTITSATLSLFCTGWVSGSPVLVHASYVSGSWNECDVKWVNKPSQGGLIGDLTASGIGRTSGLDILSAVLAWRGGTDNNGINLWHYDRMLWFGSANGSQTWRPQLVVEYSPAFSVTNVNIDVDPETSEGNVLQGGFVTGDGTITGTGSGTVEYYWMWRKPGGVFDSSSKLTATMSNGSANIPTYNSFPTDLVGEHKTWIRIQSPDGPDDSKSNDEYYTVAGEPDLRISYFEPRGEQHLEVGQGTSISFKAQNVGSEAAGSFKLYLKVHGTAPSGSDPVGTNAGGPYTISSLAPSTETGLYTVNISYNVPGDYYFFAIADPPHLNEVAESDDNDNASHHHLSPGYLHVEYVCGDDWDVEALSFTPSKTNPAPGEQIAVAYSVRNNSISCGTPIGTQATTINEIRWSEDSDLLNGYTTLEAESMPALDPGELWQSGNIPVTIPSSAVPGQTYYMGVVVDVPDVIHEEDREDNNVASVSSSGPTPGVTVLVHGLKLTGDGIFDDSFDPVDNYWDDTDDGRHFVESILTAFGGGKVLVYQPGTGELAPYSGSNLQLRPGSSIYRDDGHLVVVHNWAASSNDPESGHAEGAASALFAALVSANLIEPQTPSNSSRFHFIGHSRGAPVASEVVQRMGVYGIPVHYVTYLDPHDFDEADVPLDALFHDPAVQVWTNVKYADNFWQRARPVLVPSGRPLLHLQPSSYEYNQDLTELPHFYWNTWPLQGGEHTSSHGMVIDYYLGTIIPGTHQYRDEWYGDNAGGDCGFSLWLQKDGFDFDNPNGDGRAGLHPNADPSTFGNIISYYEEDGETGQDENCAPTDFFMGVFSLTDLDATRTAGWYYHGGEGTGAIVNGQLQLGGAIAGLQRSHDRFYLPHDATHIRFWWRASQVNHMSHDRLQVIINDGASDSVVWEQVLADAGSVKTAVDVPVSIYASSVITLEFRLVNQSGQSSGVISVVMIDDIEIIHGAGSHIRPLKPTPGAPVGEIHTFLPVFSWSSFQDGGDGQTQAGYQLRVRCDDDGDSIVYETGLIEETSAHSHTYSPGSHTGEDPVTGADRVSEQLEWGKNYHWHVRYRDSGGDWSDWSADVPGAHQDFSVVDNEAPGAPQGLTVTPSDWSNQNIFNISWTNPADLSGIAGAYYKVGSPPTSDADGQYVDGPPPMNVNMDTLGLEGSYAVYVWLKDNAGNVDHNNRAEGLIKYDSTPPVANAGPDQTVEQESYDGTEVTLVGFATDICDPDPDLDWYEGGTWLGSGGMLVHTFQLGQHVVTLEATDDSENTDQDDVVVTVVDTTEPIVDAGPDQTVEQESYDGTEVTLVGFATDICDPDPDLDWYEGGTWLGSGGMLVHTFQLGQHVVTLEATDDSENAGQDDVVVTVVDTTEPIADAGGDVTVDRERCDGTEVVLNGLATDICDSDPDLDWYEGGTWLGSGGTLVHTFPPGVHSVTLKATDDSGNVDEDGATVTVMLVPLTLYIDDNAVNDPGPGDPLVGDPDEDGTLEHPFDAIQQAIDCASDGDMVIVRDGTYTGDGNRDIDFNGKGIHLMSENGPDNCVIDCQQQGRGFYFHSGEDETSVVDGFTVANGNADGGGIYCCESSPTIANNTITGNTANGDGGGIWCVHCSPTITNNTITGNTTNGDGGGIGCFFAWPTITNNTITGNTANGDGGGIGGWEHFSAVNNNILWANSAPTGAELSDKPVFGGPYDLTVGYSNVAGGAAAAYAPNPCTLNWGPGNIDGDPLFADPGHWDDNGTPDDTSDDVWIDGDYHLKSKHGRWDPTENAGDGGWVYDDVTSPCIDKGDPDSEYADEPMPNFGRINMGAYGNTAEASKSGWNIPADVTGDCKVNILDMIAVRNHTYEDAGTDDNWRYDFTGDGQINILDMIVVRNHLNTMCKDGGGLCPTTPALQDFSAPENPIPGEPDILLTVRPPAMDSAPDTPPDEVNVYLNGNLIGHLVIDTAAGSEVGFDLEPGDNVVTLEYSAGGGNDCAIVRAIFEYMGGNVVNLDVWIAPGGSTSCTITLQE